MMQHDLHNEFTWSQLQSEVNELREKTKAAWTEQRLINKTSQSERSRMQGEIGQIWVLLAAIRDETFRSAQEAQGRTEDTLQTVAEVAEGSRRLALDTSNNTHRHVEAVIKTVDSLVQEIEDIRRMQGSFEARLDGENAAATDHVAGALTKEDVTELRGDINNIERNTANVLARQTALQGEVLRREWRDREQEAAHRQAMTALEERVRMCEGKIATSTGKKRALQQEDIASQVREDPNTAMSGTSLMQLEHRLQGRLFKTMQNITSGMTGTLEDLAAKLNEVRNDFDLEKTSWMRFEKSIIKVVKTALTSLAKATSHELSKYSGHMRNIDKKLSSLTDTIGATLASRCSHMEGQIINSVTEQEKNMASFRNEVRSKTHHILGQMAQEKDAQVSSRKDAFSDMKQVLAACEVRQTAQRLADDTQLNAIAKLEMQNLHSDCKKRVSCVAKTLNTLNTKTHASFLKVHASCTDSFVEANERSKRIKVDLENRQDDLEVKTTIESMVTRVVEAQQAKSIDVFTADFLSKDAAHKQAALSKLISIESRFVTEMASLKSQNTCFQEVHHDTMKALSERMKSASKDLQRVNKNWEAQSAVINLMTYNLAARVEAINIVQSMVSTITERQGQTQYMNARHRISALCSKLNVNEHKSGMFIQRLSSAEKALARLAIKPHQVYVPAARGAASLRAVFPRPGSKLGAM